MELEKYLFNRISSFIDSPHPIGNVIHLSDEFSHFLIWDIPFVTGREAVMFQKLYLSFIASVYSGASNVSATIEEEKIIVGIEGRSGVIVTPTSVLAESKIHSFGNHYKGQISIVKELVTPEIISGFQDVFYQILNEINNQDLKI